jgi:hypothetical protein|tara:strand:- start:509 stop:3106 length:2598 start_codon:yes stop_codon:yes gene_type:complete
MAKASPPFNNFTAGELSPRLEGRTDVSKYFNGCKKLQNFLIHPHGGASRRPGTKYVNTVKASANFTRLIPFEFNVEQAYILEFGNQYFRIHKDGGTVVDGSSNAIEVSTVYLTAQVADIKFTQSADVMYLTHPLHPVQKITRTSHTAWTISEVAFLRGPMQDPNTTDTTLTSNGRTGSGKTITASASTFVSTDVGRLLKLHDGFAKVTGFTSATVVTATVQENAEGRSELMPAYVASTIAFYEGDPSSTGLEHNDRITDTTGSFITQGFKVGQKATITGAGTSGNNITSGLIVQVSADTILFSPSVDLVNEAAGQAITLNGDLTADDNFSLGAFSTTTGHPAAVTFYEQRLVFGNTNAQPQTLFFSVGGSFEDFADGIDADDALTYTIGSNQVNVIRYLASGRVLIVGTSGGEFAVSASGSSVPLSPTNAQIKRQANYGSANIQPIQVGNVTMFVQRASRKIRELVYNFDTDSYQAPDLTVLAEHITDTGITDVAFQQEPDNIVWCVLTNGNLVGMTYRREEEVVGWHEHIVGGRFGECTVTVSDYANIAVGTTLTFTKSDGSTVTFTSEAAGGTSPASATGFRPNESNNTTADNIFTAINAHADFTVANPSAAIVVITETIHSSTGFLSCLSSDTTRLETANESQAVVESIAVVPGDLNEDSLYMIVKRTVNGATVRFIEYFSAFDFGNDIEDAFFVDSGLTYSGSAATSISGLNHLEGQTVSILANGATHPDKVVASGAISLDRSVTKAHIGLAYNSILQTMRVDAGGTEGTAQGKIKRIHDITLRLFNTAGISVGSSETEIDRIPFRSSANVMGSALPMFTGDKEVEFRGGFDNDGFIVIKQNQPLPATILAIFPRLQTFDQ